MSDKLDDVLIIEEAIGRAEDILKDRDYYEPPIISQNKRLFQSPVIQTVVKFRELRENSSNTKDFTQANVISTHDLVFPSVVFGVTGIAERGGSFKTDSPFQWQISVRSVDYKQANQIDKEIWKQLKTGRGKASTVDYQDDYEDVGDGIYVVSRSIVIIG